MATETGAATRPFIWEKSYPPGMRWDLPIPSRSLGDVLRQAVRDYASRPFLEYRDHSIDFAAFGRRAEGFAAALLRAGLGPGSTIALYLPNTPYHPIAFLGAALAGVRVTHLSPLDAERELAHKLSDSGASLLLTVDYPGLLGMALKLQAAGAVERLVVASEAAWGLPAAALMSLPQQPGLVGFDAFVAEAPLPVAWPEVKPEAVALLQYTGGTTGRAKGAMLTHANLTAALAIYDEWYNGQGEQVSQRQRVIGVLPLFHIYALTTILLRQLSAGGEILLRPRFDVETTLHDIEVKRATAFPGVPTMWIALANFPGIETRDFSSLEHCGSGGAPLPVEVAARFEKLTGQRLGGGWGMTETSPAGTAHLKHGPHKPGSVGLPLPGIEMDVVALDDPRRRLGPNQSGELRIKGPNVTPGYWNRPEETAASFVDGYFLTGDIGHMDADGYFYLVDRKKDMIISGGFNVYPQLIEQAIYEHPAVAEVLVIGVPDGYRGEAAKAFITLRPGQAEFSLDELKQFLADKIGRHEMPAALEFRDALPRTPVGKLSKKELRDEERAKTQG
ncbi:dicarboxylate--CoA ligase PimA [Ferrovibrio sp.]|uniref:dicarboxylate--CoA ligase PimA n=1 Tax=Ferrovibrio sp. TaxID=1917215 RepID=UPI001B4A2A7B|nr:dicarboxylate--CoA ligase PimA [Ferrovibrio sp.]MBP7063772.1 dicarboxylate--CoA ligase PimA [Ferrovibrio sp.]